MPAPCATSARRSTLVAPARDTGVTDPVACVGEWPLPRRDAQCTRLPIERPCGSSRLLHPDDERSTRPAKRHSLWCTDRRHCCAGQCIETKTGDCSHYPFPFAMRFVNFDRVSLFDQRSPTPAVATRAGPATAVCRIEPGRHLSCAHALPWLRVGKRADPAPTPQKCPQELQTRHALAASPQWSKSRAAVRSSKRPRWRRRQRGLVTFETGAGRSSPLKRDVKARSPDRYGLCEIVTSLLSTVPWRLPSG